MTAADWLLSPTQRTSSGGNRHIAGPVVTPRTYLENGTTYTARACCITGHCAAGKHGKCWQADGQPDPGHAPDDCNEPHRLVCRCHCHQATPADSGHLF